MKNHPDKVSTCRGYLAGLIVQAAVLASAVPVSASTIITWDGASNISGDTDVRTAGTLVGAYKLGAAGVANTTVNGVTFTGLVVSGNSVTSGNFNLATASSFGASNSAYAPGPFGLSASYEALISSMLYTYGVPWTLTMTGLVAGATYQFQWWSNDNLGSGTGTTATAGGSVSLFTTAGGYGPARWLPGQFAIGSFVADATTSQSVTFSTGYFTEVNAFQLRQISAVPDTSSTFALLALGLFGLTAVVRWGAPVLRKG